MLPVLSRVSLHKSICPVYVYNLMCIYVSVCPEVPICGSSSQIWPSKLPLTTNVLLEHWFICLNLLNNQLQYFLHLGLVSSKRIAWNASHDCPYQSIVYPLRFIGGQWPPLWSIATRPWHLTGLLVRYLSSFHTIWAIYQNSRAFFIIRTNYLPIIDILLFTIYTP